MSKEASTARGPSSKTLPTPYLCASSSQRPSSKRPSKATSTCPRRPAPPEAPCQEISPPPVPVLQQARDRHLNDPARQLRRVQGGQHRQRPLVKVTHPRSQGFIRPKTIPYPPPPVHLRNHRLGTLHRPVTHSHTLGAPETRHLKPPLLDDLYSDYLVRCYLVTTYFVTLIPAGTVKTSIPT